MITFVPAEVVRPLRHAVLRPTRPLESAHLPEDDLPDTFHVAARAADGKVIGCATFFPRPLVGVVEPTDASPAWILRGMATDAARQGLGIGGAVLEAGVAEVIRRGGLLLWCKGRTSAGDFYRRHGFVARGDEFDVPTSGPHLVFVRTLSKLGATTNS